jgi:hypothetical protein
MKFNTCGKAIALALTVGASIVSAPLSYGFAQEPNKDTAQQEKPKDKPNAGAAAQQANTVTITGMVTGGEKNVLTVTDNKNVQFKVTVTSDTKVSKAGKAATPADLKPNDKVTVQAKSGTDGTLTAMTIDIGGE